MRSLTFVGLLTWRDLRMGVIGLCVDLWAIEFWISCSRFSWQFGRLGYCDQCVSVRKEPNLPAHERVDGCRPNLADMGKVGSNSANCPVSGSIHICLMHFPDPPRSKFRKISDWFTVQQTYVSQTQFNSTYADLDGLNYILNDSASKISLLQFKLFSTAHGTYHL